LIGAGIVTDQSKPSDAFSFQNGLEEIPDLSTWPPEARESLMRDLDAMQRVADRYAAGEITEAEMESEYFRLLEERDKGLGAGG
jgi:hypothetical protein